ncbi:unnamed protein product, partial [Staurois parvus]
SKIHPFLTSETTKQLIHSLVISRLDYCNFLLIGCPHRWLSPLRSRSVSATPFYQSLHCPPLSVCQSLHWSPFSFLPPLCQSLHWPPLSVLHPSLPIPPLASTQCPPSLSANLSTGLHSVSSTPLCQSLHWPPLSVLNPSLPIPPLASHCPT